MSITNLSILIVILALVLQVSADFLFSSDGGSMYSQPTNLYSNITQNKTSSSQSVYTNKSIVFGGVAYDSLTIYSNSAITFYGTCIGTTFYGYGLTINLQSLKQTQLTITNDDYVTMIEYHGCKGSYCSQKLQWKLVLYYGMYFKAQLRVTTFSLSGSNEVGFFQNTSFSTYLYPAINSTINLTGCYINCEFCSAYNVCTSCLDSFVLTSDNLCSSQNCPSWCKVCNQYDVCLDCRSGYYYDNYTCFSCSEDCSSCTNSSVCTVCSSGYTLSSGNCVKIASNNTTSSSGVIVGAVAGSLSAIVLMTIGCLYWRKKRRENQDNISEGSAVPLQRSVGPRDNSKVYKASVFVKNPDLITTEVCSICLDPNTTSLSTCGHFFHPSCIVDWFSKQRDCPLCRTKEIGLEIGCQGCHKLFQIVRFCEPSCAAGNHRACLQARSADLKFCFQCRNKNAMSSSEQFPLGSNPN